MEDYKYSNTPMGQAFEKASSKPEGRGYTISGSPDDEDVITRRFKTASIDGRNVVGYMTYDRETGKIRYDIDTIVNGKPGKAVSSGWMDFVFPDGTDYSAAVGKIIQFMASNATSDSGITEKDFVLFEDFANKTLEEVIKQKRNIRERAPEPREKPRPKGRETIIENPPKVV